MLVAGAVCVVVVVLEQAIFETLNVYLIKADLEKRYNSGGIPTQEALRELIATGMDQAPGAALGSGQNEKPTWANSFRVAWQHKSYQRLPRFRWASNVVAIAWGMYSVLRLALQNTEPLKKIAPGTAWVCIIVLMPALAETVLRAVHAKCFDDRPGTHFLGL
jgi:hypothetical protein